MISEAHSSAAAGATSASGVVAYRLHGNCYLNITNRCTLRCRFCPKFNRNWTVQDYALRLHTEPTPAHILDAVGDPQLYREVVFCGLGEPTIRLDACLEVSARLRAQGARIRINTDGLANLRAGHDVTPRMRGCVDALSVSLNAQDEATYIRHCRPTPPNSFAAVTDFLRLARAHVSDITVTAVDGLPGVDIAACRRIAERLGVNFRRRVLDQVG